MMLYIALNLSILSILSILRSQQKAIMSARKRRMMDIDLSCLAGWSYGSKTMKHVQPGVSVAQNTEIPRSAESQASLVFCNEGTSTSAVPLGRRVPDGLTQSKQPRQDAPDISFVFKYQRQIYQRPGSG